MHVSSCAFTRCLGIEEPHPRGELQPNTIQLPLAQQQEIAVSSHYE